ncbi:MAG: glycosyltransferase [Muribaculaceae bacterium]|nr:glycosyltransferase [Muribaculaceae bacterium]
MDSEFLISVITVAYNAEGVIGRTLESLESQTYKDFEYILIDGKSTDKTVAKVEEAGIKNKVIVSEPDKGLYDAMNKGLRKARGKYVLFLNAGDSFHSADTLSLYAKGAENGADIIYGDTIIVDKNGEKLGERHLRAPEFLTHNSFASGMLICHQAFMVRKELAPEYDLKYRFSADYDWCVKCIKTTEVGGCINLKRVTIDYLSDGLTDKNKYKSLKERFRIMSRHYGYLPTLWRHLGFAFRALKRGKV